MKSTTGLLETKVFIGAIFVVILSGILVMFVERHIKSKEKNLNDSYTMALWKFVPETSIQEEQNYDRWSWRKLIFAGFMIAGSVVSVVVKRLGAKYSLLIGLLFMFGWTAFLLYFWHFTVLQKYKEKSNSSQTSGSLKQSNENKNDELKNNNNKMKNNWDFRKLQTDKKDNRMPVTIVTGFLGSGKTTLIKNILDNTLGMKILVIENEIGEEGVDHELLLQTNTQKEEIILLKNGCICCSVRKDLLTTLSNLLNQSSFATLDWIVIETTGVADPAPLIQTLYMDDNCRSHFRIDGIITLIDALHLPQLLLLPPQNKNSPSPSPASSSSSSTSLFSSSSSSSTRKGGGNGGVGGVGKGVHGGVPEVVQQIAFADVILINKIDLLPPEEKEEGEENEETEGEINRESKGIKNQPSSSSFRFISSSSSSSSSSSTSSTLPPPLPLSSLLSLLSSLNPTATLFPCHRSLVNLEHILNIKSFQTGPPTTTSPTPSSSSFSSINSSISSSASSSFSSISNENERRDNDDNNRGRGEGRRGEGGGGIQKLFSLPSLPSPSTSLSSSSSPFSLFSVDSNGKIITKQQQKQQQENEKGGEREGKREEIAMEGGREGGVGGGGLNVVPSSTPFPATSPITTTNTSLSSPSSSSLPSPSSLFNLRSFTIQYPPPHSSLPSAPLSLPLLNRFLLFLLEKWGERLYRGKGFLWVDGQERVFTLQIVHMVLDGARGELWEDREKREKERLMKNGEVWKGRVSRLVFIGVGLDEKEITQAFLNCVLASKSQSQSQSQSQLLNKKNK